MRFIVIIIFLLISCFKFDKKKPISWRIYKKSGFRIEELYIDSNCVQQNFYKNDKIDSFILLTRFEYYNNPTFTSSKVTPETMKLYYSFFRDRDYNVGDSMKVALWMPVERNFTYTYKMYKDDSLVWNISENNPIIKFAYPFSPVIDTSSHIFRIERTISKNKFKMETIKHNLWIEKRGELLPTKLP